MRNFYKTPLNVTNVPLMLQVMREQATLFDESGYAKPLPSSAKLMALGVMQVTNGIALGDVALQQLPHDSKALFGKGEANQDHFIIVLHGQIMCLIGEECPAFNIGETWWVDAKEDAIIINKSGDDAMILKVAITVG